MHVCDVVCGAEAGDAAAEDGDMFDRVGVGCVGSCAYERRLGFLVCARRLRS